MFSVVTGGSGSGKSAYAEQRVLSFGEHKRIYIATMMCFDEESKKRVARHRLMRRGKGFETIEQCLDLAKVRIPEHSVVLLECMSNLAANEMFDPKGAGENTAAAIKAGVHRLLPRCDHLVVVTNEVFSDGMIYEAQTREYQRVLGEVNCYMAGLADEVTEVVYGIPIRQK
ncbi:MAG: bifunctional adenosylcobinamide kinase/adenosylcobinamide-phosphate guanylyltransferase [Lachnospiraceae bacterium]|nr:bifunctional adenosylcobinamide kinase/adenosylcobinamide-phosphate guanylyltransferase [Lachnospiraceae bacterium]